MKNNTTLLYVCIVISVINICAILFFSLNLRRTNNQVPVVFDNSGQAVRTTDAYFPKSASFAGEKVPLNRIDVRESLKKELIVNSYWHSQTIQLLKNAPRYFHIIEPILKEEGIPEDFKYLAVIESSLNPLAYSPAGAAGLWQFMEGTAQEFGMEVDKQVDERYNIEKSTRAAAAYLKKAYRKFGSWTTAAASYNAGMKMLANQMEIQKENNYYDLLLGDETGRYVFRILALKEILAQPDKYNFHVEDTYSPEKTKVVEVKESIDNWADFAQKQNVSYKTLKRFNPWLRKNELKNARLRTYYITIPVKTEDYK